MPPIHPYLLAPRTIAVVGASTRTYHSANILRGLKAHFPGKVYGVNPSYTEIDGIACYPSVADIPDRIDHAVFVIARQYVPAALENAAKAGIKAATIVSSGFAESGNAQHIALERQIAETCRAYGISLCGPNCNGLIDTGDDAGGGAWAFAGPAPAPLPRGGLSIVSQSGALIPALVQACMARGLGFASLVSSGNEAVTIAEDYLETFVADDRTKVICAYVEGFREPVRLEGIAREALKREKPIIMIKIGRTSRGREAALSHSAALTGEDRVFDVAFREWGILRVTNIDQMIDVASGFCRIPKHFWPRGRRAAGISISGGACSLLADLAEDFGIELPDMPEADRLALQQLAPPEIVVKNPFDLTGIVQRNPEFKSVAHHSLMACEGFDAVISLFGQPDALAEQIGEPTKAVFMDPMVTGHIPGRTPPKNVALIYGLQNLLHAFSRMVDFSEAVARQRVWPGRPQEESAPLPAVDADPSLDEAAGKAFLRQHGIGVPPGGVVASLAAAQQLAESIGYPVVLKGLLPGVYHKTELGMVALNIGDPAVLAAEHRRLAGMMEGKGRILLEAMVTESKVEVMLGLQRTDLGWMVTVAPGGVDVGSGRRSASRLAPVSCQTAMAMLSELDIFAQLTGSRGRKAFDTDALAGAIEVLSEAALSWQAFGIAEFEINPVAVLAAGRGITALDAVSIPGDRKERGGRVQTSGEPHE